MNAARHHTRSDDGFTMIEVLVAAVLLLIGVFATLALLDQSTQATAVSKQRDVANALVQEVVERAQGGRYTLANNDMTDVDSASTLPGPADRMRAALDPDGDSASTAVVPTTVTAGTIPNLAAQSWSVKRKNATYAVSYRACTVSDVYQQVQIQGPFDCARSPANPNGTDSASSGSCSLGVIPPTQVNPADPGTLTVKLQVLGLTGLSVCVGALAPQLSAALCTLAGNSAVLNGITGSLLGSGGALTGLLGAVRSNATLGVCSPTQVDQSLAGARNGIATSTRLTVTVAWTDFKGKAHSLAQTAIVRRATT